MYNDRYGSDVLFTSPTPAHREVVAQVGLLIEEPASGFVGEIVKVHKVAGQWVMELEDRNFRRRAFPLGPGYWIDGRAVALVPPRVQVQEGRRLTASGSLHVEHEARVAKASRIWVEGKHDAELISKIWGADLAYEGIMIEELFGADNLLDVLEVFGPSEQRRAGVMLDHMVAGSKEARIAEQAQQLPGVLVLGHPYVDIWQAVKPATIGIKTWPDVPRGQDIKVGTLQALGWPAETAEDIGLGWKKILDSVHTYRDLEPAFLGRMEELIDFVTAV